MSGHLRVGIPGTSGWAPRAPLGGHPARRPPRPPAAALGLSPGSSVTAARRGVIPGVGWRNTTQLTGAGPCAKRLSSGAGERRERRFAINICSGKVTGVIFYFGFV